MRTFTIIWFGQLISTIGSYMTNFALTLWAWQLTGSATTLALVGFFGQLPSIPVNLIAGIIVDRCDRKQLMILGDSIAAVSTIGIGILYFTNSLEIWHLYLAATVNGGFGQIQSLAYQTSIVLIVPRSQLTRANSMNSSVHYGSVILGPALAGILYPLIGLPGIVLLDLATFCIAIATLLAVFIPPPNPQDKTEIETLFFTLTIGFRQVWQHPNLRLLLLISTLFWFFHDLGSAIDDSMILARSNSNAQALASISAAAGIGGVLGAIGLSLWGGPKRRSWGMLAGFIGAGVSKTVFGLGQLLQVWIPAQFCSSLNFPLLSSSETAIWMEKIAPEMQGRVFAANALVLQVVSAIATLIAGLLADRVFEPALMSGGRLTGLFGRIFGTGAGAGISLLYVLCSLAMIVVGIVGFCLPKLRRIEKE
ncbi:MFS transporter [[Phormidium ambiguum] IAM M-71]|uniref:MFS transporter n=1 Tax=[Phormidium ambiguum] IAM M-71 TaxID=454136 RepID=A0A1U7IKZ1_9CYAN|nr:MFS transporter [Phormidium ambiguum]OKH37856.1 MFS transporter [Phormidium ambiguum IAM M-71]